MTVHNSLNDIWLALSVYLFWFSQFYILNCEVISWFSSCIFYHIYVGSRDGRYTTQRSYCNLFTTTTVTLGNRCVKLAIATVVNGCETTVKASESRGCTKQWWQDRADNYLVSNTNGCRHCHLPESVKRVGIITMSPTPPTYEYSLERRMNRATSSCNDQSNHRPIRIEEDEDEDDLNVSSSVDKKLEKTASW